MLAGVKNVDSQRTALRAATLVVALAATFALSGREAGSAASSPPGTGSTYRVVIDPGHGGTDPGAIGNGIVEKEINLEVALKLRDLLVLDTGDSGGGAAWDVLMTRTDDTSISLGGRTSLANSWPADYFVSIHHNAFSSSAANGTESFSFSDGTTSAFVRDNLQGELLSAHGLFDRGSKTANFFVLRETVMPAALTEAGFLSNPTDAAVLSAPGSTDRAAEAHLFALQRSVGAAPYLPSDGPSNYCVNTVNPIGCSPTISATGSPSLSGPAVQVVGNEILSQQFGLMIWSRTQAATPFFGGTLCVGGSIVRTPIQFSNGFGPQDCSGRFEFTMDAAFLAASGIAPGEEIFAQYWFRDPTALGVGLTDGIRLAIRP